jgi:hypothetical protein
MATANKIHPLAQAPAKAPVPPHGFRGHGHGPRTGDEQPNSIWIEQGKFGRMFALAPLNASVDDLTKLGQAMVKAQPDNNPDVVAGFTYFGQFVDHDLTFDTTAFSEVVVDPLAVQNFRTPKLDLDSIYGQGPVAQPYLYQREDPNKLLIGKTSSTPGKGDPTVQVSLPNDLPRATTGFALVGDARNDENLVVAQLHLAIMKFHNKVVDHVVASGTVKHSIFEDARELTMWHYQWIVLHEFLELVLDKGELQDVLTSGRKFYKFGNEPGSQSEEPYIPIEFSVAAYRFGHTMVREVYNYNRVFKQGGVTPATLALLFKFTGLSGDVAPIPSDWIADWRRFFDISNTDGVGPNPSLKMDPFLTPQLHNLPGNAGSLAVRNLLRGHRMQLPSGQTVANRMGIPALTPAQIGAGPDGQVAHQLGFDQQAPLWYYILKEAEVQQAGKRLGQVGSRIVAEVFVGMLEGDPLSFLSFNPTWTPTLGPTPGKFKMADLLNFVGEVNPVGGA